MVSGQVVFSPGWISKLSMSFKKCKCMDLTPGPVNRDILELALWLCAFCKILWVQYMNWSRLQIKQDRLNWSLYRSHQWNFIYFWEPQLQRDLEVEMHTEKANQESKESCNYVIWWVDERPKDIWCRSGSTQKELMKESYTHTLDISDLTCERGL